MFRNLYPSLIVLALAVGGSYVWLQSDGLFPTASTELAAIETIAGVTDVQATDGDPVDVLEMTLGDANAPVTIIEYASFTCPHCARFHEEVFGKIATNYIDTGKVRFVMRDIYFDRLGLWAALLARCDGGSKFFGISDIVYKTQSQWTKGDTNVAIANNLKKIGRIAGLDDATMDACLQDSAKAQALVEEYQKNSTADDVQGTPTFFINGKKYPNMIYADFVKAIDGVLAGN